MLRLLWRRPEPEGTAGSSTTPCPGGDGTGDVCLEQLLLPVPDSFVFAGEPVAASPYPLLVLPAPLCAAQSTASREDGQRLLTPAVATAGVASHFFVTARDAYGNRFWRPPPDIASCSSAAAAPAGCIAHTSAMCAGGGGDAVGLVVRIVSESLSPIDSVFPILGDSVLGYTSALFCEDGGEKSGVFRVRYTATRAGPYRISVAFRTDGVAGFPVQLSVEAGHRHLASCSLSGAGVTVATAGATTYLTISLRDQFQNIKRELDALDAGLRLVLREEESGAISQTPPQPVGALAQDADLAQRGSGRLTYMVTRAGIYSLHIAGNR